MYDMKNDNKKIKEPFEPHGTPEPPQIKEPNSGSERENPVKEDDRKPRNADNAEKGKAAKQHLLADETDIDDDTTI